ncbi:threonine/serine exporter family protein [Tumebacillus sp. ITR2]|uniref:Threonine/serine exporter family protein n=1 Tax=Tumebacillus amylolyticus TaxID=2801339 RepID=A0ABS1J531_9BACL|nr:threonine/serine exporter family protein [Tumebacillus amylolyticus]MBL0385375.1 threonine/serine exporter family protein [Tumebacillus amylolyticus]
MSSGQGQDRVLDLCLRAGDLMLKHGAETSRVEETIVRVGRASGAKLVHSFVTPTGIFISVGAAGAEKTGLIRIRTTSAINLYKVHEVNDLSRRFERGQLTIDEMFDRLNAIDAAPPHYRIRYQHVAAAISSGAFTMLFGGGWSEFLIGSVCGWLSNTTMESMFEHVPRFLRVFIAALVGVLVAALSVKSGFSSNLEAAVIGAVIPLVPGLSLTNAIRDLMAGELLSGVARASEATLTAFAIAVAVALVLSFISVGVEVAP